MNVLEIFDPKSMPFGILSNIALHEIKLDKQKGFFKGAIHA